MLKLLATFVFVLSISCAHRPVPIVHADKAPPTRSGLLTVNGVTLYHEIHGSGEPLVLLHGGGSSIDVSFGRGLRDLASEFQVIAFDEQGHGRSPHSDRQVSFENTADDIAAALKQLGISNANFLGFSNGGTTGLYLAIRHPGLLKKMIVGSALYRRDGAPPQFWQMMKGGKFENMPQELKDFYVKIAPTPGDLRKMHDGDAQRMNGFKDIPDKSMRSISIPVLVMQTDRDVSTVEHGLKMSRLLPNGRLAILPGTHDNFLGEVSSVPPDSEMRRASISVIREFLKAKE